MRQTTTTCAWRKANAYARWALPRILLNAELKAPRTEVGPALALRRAVVGTHGRMNPAGRVAKPQHAH
jgi:hypothetical protein